MTAAAGLATWLLLALHMPQKSPTLGEAIAAANTGRFAAAWTIGGALGSELERTQARVYVLARAGQLRAALAEANAGIEHGFDDPWLFERSCALSIALREPELAARRIRELSRFLERPDGAATWGSVVAEYEVSLAGLVERRRALSEALARARTCVAVLGGLLVCALGVASRVAGRVERRPP